MTRYFKISLALLTLFVIYAPTCTDDMSLMREEAIFAKAKSEIREEFETDQLNNVSLHAYETAAEQKLYDLSDYLRILIDTTLDQQFRIKAAEIILNSFDNKKVAVNLHPGGNNSSVQIPIGRFVELGLDNALSTPPCSFKSVFFAKPFQLTAKGSYSGSIEFSQDFRDSSHENQIIKNITRRADVFLKKEVKIFGEDTLNVWNLRLGDIR